MASPLLLGFKLKRTHSGAVVRGTAVGDVATTEDAFLQL